MGDDVGLQFIVKIMNEKTKEIVKQVDCGSNMRKAERVREGVSINLNHAEYSVFITIQELKQCNHTNQTA